MSKLLGRLFDALNNLVNRKPMGISTLQRSKSDDRIFLSLYPRNIAYRRTAKISLNKRLIAEIIEAEGNLRIIAFDFSHVVVGTGGAFDWTGKVGHC